MARITVLREEEKQKSQMIKEKTEKNSKQIVSLKCAIRDVEEQMKAGDDAFLQVPINAHRQTQTYECHFQKSFLSFCLYRTLRAHCKGLLCPLLNSRALNQQHLIPEGCVFF